MSGNKKVMVATSVDEKVSDSLSRRAVKMGITKSAFLRLVISDWVESGKTLTITEN